MSSLSYHTPGVYVAEIPAGPRPIQAVGTSTAVFIGEAPLDSALVNQARAVNNWSEFLRQYTPDRNRQSTLLSNAVYGFFDNGGTRCFVVNTGGEAGLVDALAADAQKKLDAAVKAGKLTQAEADDMAAGLKARLTDLVNGRFPAPPFGGPEGFHGGHGFRGFHGGGQNGPGGAYLGPPPATGRTA